MMFEILHLITQLFLVNTKVMSPIPASCAAYTSHLYVIKVVSNMRQVGGFLCVFSISLTNKIDRHHISVKDETRKISHCGNNSKIKMKIHRNW